LPFPRLSRPDTSGAKKQPSEGPRDSFAGGPQRAGPRAAPAPALLALENATAAPTSALPRGRSVQQTVVGNSVDNLSTDHKMFGSLGVSTAYVVVSSRA